MSSPRGQHLPRHGEQDLLLLAEVRLEQRDQLAGEADDARRVALPGGQRGQRVAAGPDRRVLDVLQLVDACA